MDEEAQAQSQGLPSELITLQKFMKESTLKTEHQKMFQKLDNNIEERLIEKEQKENPPKVSTPNAYGSEQEQGITQIFTKAETKKLNPLADI